MELIGAAPDWIDATIIEKYHEGSSDLAMKTLRETEKNISSFYPLK